MKMGSKENYSPTNFNTDDATLIAQSPMMIHKEGHKDDSEKQKKEQPGVNYGYADKKGGIRGGFNKAFKEAKAKGYSTFSFGYDKNKDKSITGDEVKKYSTKTK